LHMVIIDQVYSKREGTCLDARTNEINEGANLVLSLWLGTYRAQQR